MRLVPLLALAGLLLAPTAGAHDQASDHKHLDSRVVARALGVAEKLMPKSKVRPLERNAPAAAFLRWLAGSAKLGERERLTKLAADLRRAGYKGGNLVDQWESELLQILIAHDAVRLRAVGIDTRPLYKKLGRLKASDRRVPGLRKKILLAGTTARDAKAIASHKARIQSLLDRARRGR